MKFVFRFRVMLTILSVAFLMVMTLSVLNYYETKRLMTENYILNLEDKLSLQAQRFDQIMQQMYQQTVHLSKQPQMQEMIVSYLEQPDKRQTERISNQLSDLQTSVQTNCELYLCIPQVKKAFCSTAYHSDLQAETEDFNRLTQHLSERSLTPIFLGNPFVQAEQNVFGYIVPIQDAENNEIAFLFIALDERLLYYELLAPLNTATASQESYHLVSSFGTIHSTKSASELFTGFDTFPSMKEKQMNADIHNRHLLTVTVKAPLSQYFLVCQSDLNVIAGALQQQLISQLFVLFLAFCVLFILSVFLSYWLAKPLRELATAMDIVRKGDFTTRVKMPKTDEFSALHARFNDLISRLDELTEQVVQERMQKKQAELNALQYQIRPHFMYNTLNSIRFTAILQRNQKLAELLGDFIALLESSIQRNGAFILLKDEISLVKSFVSLQNFRYVDCFTVTYEITADAEQCYVPCLLLQPVIENAIFHSIDTTKAENLIRVEATVDDECLFIVIQDTGNGFDPNEIESDRPDDRRCLTGIGLKNIQQRLHLYYGEAAKFIIKSAPGAGTCVRFILPVSHDPQQYEL